MASRLVTPSLERKWKIPTKPKGNVWEIPLPFYAYGDEESRGMVAYLTEYTRAHGQVEPPTPPLCRLLRKQLLLWRSLPPSERQRCTERYKETGGSTKT